MRVLPPPPSMQFAWWLLAVVFCACILYLNSWRYEECIPEGCIIVNRWTHNVTLVPSRDLVESTGPFSDEQSVSDSTLR